MTATIRTILLLLTISCILAHFADAQSSQNLIRNLPGTPAGGFNFSMYSGYFPVENNQYFYWFIESEGNPSSDPIILWLNGGPGCSSLGGLLSENGPFYPDEKGNLVPNPFAWNKLANILYLESPAGVGFSYCGSGGCGLYDDNRTASDNYQVLTSFFKAYPTYAKNDFYIMGESYAGHYIPELVDLIYQNTQTNPNSAPQSNFKGFAAGNPLTDQDIDLDGPYLNLYLQTHGMIALGDTESGQATGAYNPYDILADVCSSQRVEKQIRFPHPFNNMKGVQGKSEPSSKRFVANPPECIDDQVQNYLNQQSVQTALHANPTSWTDCAGPDYSFSERSMIPLYKKFVSSTKYKIWVYSGDADTVLNFIATEKWIQSLALPVKSAWNAWYYNQGFGDQVAGWTTTFSGPSTTLTFTTIKAAGHMVPWFQPAPAFQMLQSFLNA